jgi:hypothetical protein
MTITLVSCPRPDDDLHDFQRNPSTDFVACDTCRAKPGAPELCYGCLQNRQLIGNLKRALEAR